MTAPRDVNVGIIGYGFMGRAHTYGYINLPLFYDPAPVRVNKLIMCTTSDNNVAAASATGYYTDVVRDWHRIIDDPTIDIVHICTPNNLHADMLIAAIDAGKAIYCDKPLTATWPQAQRVAHALHCANYHRPNQMHLNARFFPATMRAKHLVEAGRLGDVVSFRARQLHSTNIDPTKPVNWKSRVEIGGGGVILDLGAHVVDLMTHLLGPIRRILCRMQNFTPKRPNGTGEMIDVPPEELAVMLVEIQSGAIGTIHVSKVATGTNAELLFDIHGRSGAMRFDMMRPNWLGFFDTADDTSPLGGESGFKDIDCVGNYPRPGGAFPPGKVAIGWLQPHVHCLYEFLAAWSRDEESQPSLRRGVEIQRWLTLAYDSAKSNHWLDA